MNVRQGKRFSVLLLFLVMMGVSFAQEKEVKGTVRDASGVPLPGASVVVKGTSSGTETDFDGHFSIKIKQGGVLEFSYVGLKTKEVKVGASSNLNVVLEEDAQQLDDVVVIGYGTGRKVGTVVGSVARVGGEQIAQSPGNAVDAMQGKVAGVQIFTSSGEPSALSTIKLHGMGSLGASSTPLFVVDGIPVSQEGVRALNQADFESISILKDASATSIYGSRAANGVVYITTKRGKSGKGQVTVNTQYGLSNLANREAFDVMMNADELAKFWVETKFRTQAQVDALRKQYPYDTRWDRVYFLEDAPNYQLDLSVAGGTDKTRYYVSGGYLNQKGLMYRSGFERFTFRTNVETQVNNWLKMGANVAISYSDYITNAYTGADTNGGLSILAAPFYSPVDANGKRYDLIPGWNRYHPEYLLEKNPSNYTDLDVIPTGFISITPIKNLTFRTQGGMQFQNGTYSYNRLPSHIANPNNGIARQRAERFLQRTLTNTLEYKFSLGKNNFIALVGQEFVTASSHFFQGEGQKLINDNLLLLSHATANKEISETKSFNVTQSIFGRLDYNFQDKYYLDFSLRRDGSSKFSPRNKYGDFWAAGVMWKVKKENFLKDVKNINDLSLKFSVGTSGNSDIGNYTHQALTGISQYAGNTSFAITAAGNPDLTWERQTKYTLGINSRFFDRVTLDVDFYNRLTTDMLMDVPVNYATGFATIKKNVGELQNKGLDVTLSVDAYRNKAKDVYVRPYVTFSYNQEKVLSIFDDKQSWYRTGYGYGYVVGQPVKYFYPILKGVNPTNGDMEWYLPSSDIAQETRDDSRVSNTFSTETLTQNTGYNYNAPISGGFGLSAAYKAFSLQVDFTYNYGKYLINNDRYFTENPTRFGGFNQNRSVFDYWKKPGDVTRFPRYGVQFTQFDTGLVEDASFLRLKNVTLAYAMPKDILKEVGFFEGIRFYATGRNLLTWTKYSGADPELDSNLAMGVNPNTKQYVFGVELKF